MWLCFLKTLYITMWAGHILPRDCHLSVLALGAKHHALSLHGISLQELPRDFPSCRKSMTSQLVIKTATLLFLNSVHVQRSPTLASARCYLSSPCLSHLMDAASQTPRNSSNTGNRGGGTLALALRDRSFPMFQQGLF